MRGSLTVSYNTLVVAGQFVATLTCGAFASVHEASRAHWQPLIGRDIGDIRPPIG